MGKSGLGEGVVALGRVLMAVIFIHAGSLKILHDAQTGEMMAAHGVPAALLPLVILLKVGGGALTGLADAHSAAPSAAQLAAGGALPLAAATVAVGLALSTNAMSKVLAGFSAGDRHFGVWTATTQAAQIAAFWAAWAVQALLSE